MVAVVNELACGGPQVSLNKTRNPGTNASQEAVWIKTKPANCTRSSTGGAPEPMTQSFWPEALAEPAMSR